MPTTDNTPTIRPENSTFAKLFITAPDAVYYVPNYQRSYAWNVSPHVKQFLEDLKYCYDIEMAEEIQYQHFLGQLIMRNARERNADSGCMYFEVIDGQQRLITFTMICLVMYQIVARIRNDNASLHQSAEALINKLNGIIFQANSQNQRLLLSPKDQRYWEDIVVFYTRFQGTDITPQKVISHQKMKCAIDFIELFLRQIIDKLDDSMKLKVIEKLFNALTLRMHIISVISEPTEYMFALFQTVNDRGRLLTNGELLKAKTLESLRFDTTMQSQAERCWDEMLSDEERTTNQFLEWCYISYTGEQVGSEPSLYHQYIKHYFIESQNRHLNTGQMTSLLSKIESLKNDIAICRLLNEGLWPFSNDSRPEWQKSRVYELVRRLRHNKCIPVLLSAIIAERNLDANACDEDKQRVFDQFYQIVDIIDRFFFVYIKICSCDEANFRDAYASYAKELRDNSATGTRPLAERLNRIKRQGGCDNALDDYLQRQVYSQKKVHTTEIHLLYLMEIYYTTDLDAPLIASLDDAVGISVDRLSIEHIYAKGFPPQQQTPELEPYKNHIGNLTLLGKGKNNELERKTYQEKKSAYRNSSFRMTRGIADYEEWEQVSFQDRHDMMIALAKKIFE